MTTQATTEALRASLQSPTPSSPETKAPKARKTSVSGRNYVAHIRLLGKERVFCNRLASSVNWTTVDDARREITNENEESLCRSCRKVLRRIS